MLMEKLGCGDHCLSILIVDDDENILELLAEGFEFYGMKVLKAQSGDEAWKLFNRENVDAVLTDIWMPGMDGLELSSRIHQHSPQTTIALMTGGDTAAAKKLVEDGIVDHFFEKPFTLSFVCKSIATEVQMA